MSGDPRWPLRRSDAGCRAQGRGRHLGRARQERASPELPPRHLDVRISPIRPAYRTGTGRRALSPSTATGRGHQGHERRPTSLLRVLPEGLPARRRGRGCKVAPCGDQVRWATVAGSLADDISIPTLFRRLLSNLEEANSDVLGAIHAVGGRFGRMRSLPAWGWSWRGRSPTRAGRSRRTVPR